MNRVGQAASIVLMLALSQLLRCHLQPALEAAHDPPAPSAQAIATARKAATIGAASSTTRRRRANGQAGSPWSFPTAEAMSDPRRVRCNECIAADPRQTSETRQRLGAAISHTNASRKKE